MKRAMPWNEQVDVISSDESSSEAETEVKEGIHDMSIDQPPMQLPPEGLLTKRAEMYQKYMKQIPIPLLRGSIIPFMSWVGLGRSIKQLYGQPMHYHTNIILKQWDQLRLGSEDEDKPLDTIIHPCKAEASIWLIEEIHRQTSSHHHIAKLWQSDPMHYAYIDSVFPDLEALA